MGDGLNNPLSEALETLTKLQPQVDGDLRAQLDQVRQLLLTAQRRGDGADAETLREQVANLVQTNAQFVSVMVHEIRVPMTSIKGYSDMLAKNVVGPLNEMQAQFVETIRANVTRMEHLVSDISDISKLEAGRLRLDAKMELYKNVAAQVEKATQDLAAAHGHALVFDTPEGLPLLNLDGARLAQALTKLLINALQYTPDGGQITVRASGEPGWLTVAVSDTGIGMTPEEQAHIGELFWRADSEQVRQFKGHGLGLPIAIGLVELMGGQFFYESAAGQGSTFGIKLPALS